MFSPFFSWNIAELVLNSNHSLSFVDICFTFFGWLTFYLYQSDTLTFSALTLLWRYVVALEYYLKYCCLDIKQYSINQPTKWSKMSVSYVDLFQWAFDLLQNRYHHHIIKKVSCSRHDKVEKLYPYVETKITCSP